MNKITAYNLLTKGLNKEVNKALPGMKIIDSNARYYIESEDGDCTLLYPFLGNENDIEDGHRYSHYKINEKLYSSIGIGKIDYFENIDEKKGNEQLRLF